QSAPPPEREGGGNLLSGKQGAGKEQDDKGKDRPKEAPAPEPIPPPPGWPPRGPLGGPAAERLPLDRVRVPLGGAFQLWDLQSGRMLHRFGGHQDAVTSVAFAPKGRFLLSGSLDGTVRLWVFPDREPIPAPAPGQDLPKRPQFVPLPPGGRAPAKEKPPK